VSFIRRLTYQSEVKAIVRWLGLRKTMSRIYHHWRAPGGVVCLQVGDVTCHFWARTAEELRTLEGPAVASSIRSSEVETLGRFLSFLKPGDAVYDIGANVGLYSAILGMAVGVTGQVVAFEPDQRNYTRLQENLQLNGLTNVHSFCIALGNETCWARLYAFDRAGCLSTLVAPPGGTWRQDLVRVVGADDFRRAEKLPIPRAVKIDVEGYEYAVIQGLAKTLTEPVCQFVCCEIHERLAPSGTAPEDVVAFLRSLGFYRIELHDRITVQHALCYKC
jgi:FkbM family methyltransferase